MTLTSHFFIKASKLNRIAATLVAALSWTLLPTHGFAQSSQVKLLRTPNGGIQPQALLDAKGLIHLIYFKGEAQSGDIFYVRKEPGKEGFSEPIRVNSQPGSAIAVGTIRGAHLALGRNGRVHVAWNGCKTAHQHAGAPMLYTRMNDAGSGFEPERDLITYAAGLDGGGSVAADKSGNVYVMWHGSKSDNTEGESGRAVFVASSADDGKAFGRERPAMEKATGACGCCGMRAFADSRGTVFALYRAATEKLNRDEILLVSRNHGENFEIANAHPWKLSTCPMSSASLSETERDVIAAWETEGQIYFVHIHPGTLKVSEPVSPPGNAKRKHPVAIGNSQGEVLLAWTEGTGWQRGGSLAWQLFGANGQPSSEKGRADGVPVWGLVTAVAQADGTFVMFY